MTAKLYIDSEWRSATKLAHGVTRYAADPHCRCLLVSWALDDDPVNVWDPNERPIPQALSAALHDESVKIVMHNSFFDRTVFNAHPNVLGLRLKPERIIDTMVQALAHGLPGGLDLLSKIFSLPGELTKQSSGKRLIQLFCVPKRTVDNIEFLTKVEHPAEWDDFVEYAAHDILAMRAIHNLMPTWNYPDKEHALWCLDQKINDRGLPVDVDLAVAAVDMAAADKQRLKGKAKKLTNGEVDSATKNNALLMHIAKEHDIFLPDLKADTLRRRLENDDTPPELKSLIEVRLQASRNSASKYKRVVECVTDAGTLTGTMQMYGAARTGRDAGRVFQPQNLMRPTMWSGLDGKALDEAIELDVASIKNGAAELVYEDISLLLGNCIRSVICAPEGERMCVADLANIEGRMLIWLAGEDWKIKYFHDFDVGRVPFDNYVVAYAEAMSIAPEDVTRYQRQIGKALELSMGYGGGCGAFVSMAAVYNLDIDELADAVWASGDQRELGLSLDKYEWAHENGYHAGLEPRQYAACEHLKLKWRDAHPSTVKFWRNLDAAFRLATENQGVVYDVEGSRGLLRVLRTGSWLRIRLPSGRQLVYLQPKITDDGSLSFMGFDGFSRKFRRIKTFGGKLAENVTSGASRDVMFESMPAAEAEGFSIRLRVHDELVATVPDSSSLDSNRLAQIMADNPPWARSLPLAAAGFDCYRYRKD